MALIAAKCVLYLTWLFHGDARARNKMRGRNERKNHVLHQRNFCFTQDISSQDTDGILNVQYKICDLVNYAKDFLLS